jgi:hypothetical protein
VESADSAAHGTTGGETTGGTSSQATSDDPSTTAEPGLCVVQDWYIDADGDGFGEGPPRHACVALPDHVLASGDCDDSDPRVFPGGLACPNNPDSLVAWFRLDEGEPPLVDSSEFGHEVDVAGAPDLEEPGMFGRGLRFTGPDDVVDLQALLPTLETEGVSQEGTFEAWMKFENISDCKPPVCPRMGIYVGVPTGAGLGPHPELHLHVIEDVSTTNVFRWSGFIQGRDQIPCRLAAAEGFEQLPSAWTHLALTWDTTSCHLYLDGRLVDEDTWNGPRLGWEIARMGPPIDDPERWFSGVIDEVMVFSEPRTLEQIRQDCACGS